MRSCFRTHLLKNLRETFGGEVKELQIYRTPGTPNLQLRKNDENVTEVSAKEHSRYRTGTGMLLYLVKHSRPDISNPVRILTKFVSQPTVAAVKEMKRVIKYVLDTADYGLKIFPTEIKEGNWEMTIYTDSDWAGDKDSRRSVSGFILYLMNVPILWRSRQQKSVTLSSTEAEYVSLSEAAKEIRFVYYIMVSMGLRVRLPIVVQVDNVGAIFMSENVTTSQRTRHVDIRHAFVREMVLDGFLKVVFVRTHDNLSDGFTKNVSADIHERHTPSYVMPREEVNNGHRNREGVGTSVSDP